MDGQNERLGSLMAFSDIGLILSTYGVLLAFNFFVEPIGVNTLIVCTFFVGIKILVVGIADITGIGKSALISVIFVIIADAVILFVNYLMAFSLSRLMLFSMVLSDIIVLSVAVLLWKHYASRELPAEGESGWVTGADAEIPEESKNVVPIDQEGLDELFSDQTVEVDKNEPEVVVEEESIIDESFFTESSAEPTGEQRFSFNDVSVVSQEQEEVAVAAEPDEGFLSFEEITQEIPTEEVERRLEETYADVDMVAATEGGKTEVTETNFAQESPETVVETSEPQEPTSPTFETAETETAEPEMVFEPVVPEHLEPETPEVIEPVAETPVAAEAETVVTEAEPVSEEVIPAFSVLDLDTYKRLTGRLPRISTTFIPLSTETSQIEIDQNRTEVRQQILLLDDQLNCLISAFNRAPATNPSDRIEITDRVSFNNTLQEGDQIIRQKLKAMIDREFVSEDILRSLIETTNTINNRAYSLDVAEANLNQRKEREAERRKKQREEEEKKLQEAREKQRRAQEEARARQKEEQQRQIAEQEERERQSREKKKIKTTPILQNNEVHLQNDDLDIIIDAADLELLREFLRQQDEQTK